MFYKTLSNSLVELSHICIKQFPFAAFFTVQLKNTNRHESETK